MQQEEGEDSLAYKESCSTLGYPYFLLPSPAVVSNDETWLFSLVTPFLHLKSRKLKVFIIYIVPSVHIELYRVQHRAVPGFFQAP